MPREKCVGPTSLVAVWVGRRVACQLSLLILGRWRFPREASPCHLQRHLQTGSPGREDEINPPRTPKRHMLPLNRHRHPRRVWRKYAKATPTPVPEIWAQSSGTLVLRSC